MRYHYLPYTNEPKTPVLYLLALSNIAEYNKKTRRYDTIHYKSLDALAATINTGAGNCILSKSTLSRFLGKHTEWFTVDKVNRVITLHNNFRKGASERPRPFITISSQEASAILQEGDNFTLQYFMYLRHWAGIKRGGVVDQTREQFLSDFGYPVTSGAYLSKVSQCNTFLSGRGLVTIRA